MVAAGPSREPERVKTMFSGIAGRYDLLNHLLSANQDRRWRRKAARAAVDGPGTRLLDLCGGTGDLSLAVARQDGEGLVVCCDFTHSMLVRAAAKFARRAVPGCCLVLEADALRLPFANATFDAVTVGFGVRNFADIGSGLREICRVLRPGGRLVVLEFSRPSGRFLSRLYHWYLARVLPGVGRGVSGRGGAYRYLAQTIAGFPEPAAIAGAIRESGFSACGWETMTGGIVALHTAHK